jgi:glutathione S-transferase
MWMLNELELKYRHVPTNDHNGETRSPEYLQLNPNGKVPLLVDDDYTIFESIAINLHLARKYGGDLWFEDINMQGQVCQWSIWALMEIDENIMHVLTARDDVDAQRQFANLQAAANVIDGFLAERQYLLGDKFTSADLNAAACFSGGAFMRYNFSEFTNLSQWLKRCYMRAGANIEGSSLLHFRDLLN